MPRYFDLLRIEKKNLWTSYQSYGVNFGGERVEKMTKIEPQDLLLKFWQDVLKEFGPLVHMKELTIQTKHATGREIQVEIGDQIYCLSYYKQGSTEQDVTPEPTIFRHHVLNFLVRQMEDNPAIMKHIQAEELAVELQARLLEEEAAWWQKYFRLHFNAIDAIAQMPYEKTPAKGTLLLAPKETMEDARRLFLGNSSDVIHFKGKAPTQATSQAVGVLSEKYGKMIRKILAGAHPAYLNSPCFAVAFCYNSTNDSYECLGYIQHNKTDLWKSFPLKIEISGHHDWVLYYNDVPQFRCKNNKLCAYSDTKQEDLELVYKHIEDEILCTTIADGLRNVIECISEQGHGTAVVFYNPNDPSNAAVTERLNNLGKNQKSVLVEHPINTSAPEYLTSIAGIDGALVINPVTCNLLRIMTIVDGNVILPGDPSRGSRHNGLKTFIENVAKDGKGSSRVVAAVFSEDGGVMVYSAKQAYDEILSSRKSRHKTVVFSKKSST